MFINKKDNQLSLKIKNDDRKNKNKKGYKAQADINIWGIKKKSLKFEISNNELPSFI